MDAGDNSAGSIRLTRRSSDGKDRNRYRLSVNANHPPAVQFTTLVHELAHLFLGHLGEDNKRSVSERQGFPLVQRELEAESVAYLVSLRNGITPKSQVYLSAFVNANTTIDDLELYQVMRAAGQVETTLLGLSRPTRFPSKAEMRYLPVHKPAHRIDQPQLIDRMTTRFEQSWTAHQHRQAFRARNGDVEAISIEQELQPARHIVAAR